MKFSLQALDGNDNGVWMGWSDEIDPLTWTTGEVATGYRLVGPPNLVERAERSVLTGRSLERMPASLQFPHEAMLCMIAAMREYGNVHGPIDFAGIADGVEVPHLLALRDFDPLRQE